MIKITTINKIRNNVSERDAIVDMLNLTYPTCTRVGNIKSSILKYLDNYRPDLIVVVEDKYIDKVYRNSFSHFYSTKLFVYPEYCVRLSFLDPAFPLNKFGEDLSQDLESLYLGFMILRPIYPGCVGRTCIKPNAKINGDNLKIFGTQIRSSVLGYKAFSNGFPHSSQDDQYSTCAETSVWALMEYYGNKYPEYSPILPSDIHKLLHSLSRGKHVPSTGLLFDEIIYLIQNCGLECETYFKPKSTNINFTEKDFYRIFSCYIESGIPIIVKVSGDNGLGHAIVCIGKENWQRSEINNISEYTKDGVSYKVWNEVCGNFIFNDDNRSCYASDSFYAPTPQYTTLHPYISAFAVPLHKKIYMSAPQAITISQKKSIEDFTFTEKIIFRTFLTSGNSYKNAIINDLDLDKTYKTFFASYLNFPKFVWVTEIADGDSFDNNKVDGIVILDATENGKHTHIAPYPPLFSAYKNENTFYFDNNFRKNALSLPFRMNTYSNFK
ncbi:MAG: hypothetical protein J1E16_01250 [Muribaculaceae bacterium]|nr:hypothetical protein [Muribaculaceae bacterium]